MVAGTPEGTRTTVVSGGVVYEAERDALTRAPSAKSVYPIVRVNTASPPGAIETPENVRVQSDTPVPEHPNVPSPWPDTVTTSDPDTRPVAPPKLWSRTVYTVVPETTPSVGVPVGVFVYPNSVSFRIGRSSTNACPTSMCMDPPVKSIVTVSGSTPY